MTGAVVSLRRGVGGGFVATAWAGCGRTERMFEAWAAVGAAGAAVGGGVRLAR